VNRLITFYVEQPGTVMPHLAFLGQTPDEIYFVTGDHVPAELKAAHHAARERRLAENRAVGCTVCGPRDGASMHRLPAAGTLGLR
jgi:putative transposase